MLLWFSVTPIGTGTASVATEVAQALEAVERTGVRHHTDASGTLLEGSWQDCTEAVRAAAEAVLEHAPRVSVVCKIDWRRDRSEHTAEAKMSSLQAARRRLREGDVA